MPLSYVASTEAALLRCLREYGAVIAPEGMAGLNAVPDTFTIWRQRGEDSGVCALEASECRAAA